MINEKEFTSKEEMEELFNENECLMILKQKNKDDYGIIISKKLSIKEYTDILNYIRNDLIEQIVTSGKESDYEYFLTKEYQQIKDNPNIPFFTYQLDENKIIASTNTDNKIDLFGVISCITQLAQKSGMTESQIISAIKLSNQNHEKSNENKLIS